MRFNSAGYDIGKSERNECVGGALLAGAGPGYQSCRPVATEAAQVIVLRRYALATKLRLIEVQLEEELGAEGIQGQVDGHGDTIGEHAGRLEELEAALAEVGAAGLPEGCSEETCLKIDDCRPAHTRGGTGTVR